MVYLYFYIYTFSHHNYFWLFSQSSFSLFLVASNGCSAACSNVCSTAGLLVEHQTFYIDEKLLFSSCSWNTDGSTRRVFFLCFRFLGLLTELVQGWLWQSCKLCPGAGSSQRWLLRFSSGWKQRRFAASLRKVLQRHPSAAVCVRERKAFV